MEERKKKRIKYTRLLPAAMYRYFRDFEGSGIPSFRKFAEGIGATLEDVEGFREHKEFERSYRECSEIRRDYLIDNALCRRFDPSFVKFLLSSEYTEAAADGELTVRLEVEE